MNTVNIVKPPEGTKSPVIAPTAVKAPSAAPNFASKSVPRHLARGVIGFGLIIGSIAMVIPSERGLPRPGWPKFGTCGSSW
jgi:hypothetical protein